MRTTIECITCAAKLSIPPEAAGRKVKCPSCGTVQEAPPTAGDAFTLRPSAARGATRIYCPQCDGRVRIPASATGRTARCPHCGATVYPNQPPAPAAAPTAAPEHEPPGKPPGDNWDGEAGGSDAFGSFADALPEMSLTARVNTKDLPKRIREIVWRNEEIVYASRPAYSALVLSLFKVCLVYTVPIIFSVAAIASEGAAGAVAAIPVCVAFVFTFAAAYLHWHNQYYVITRQRTIVSTGIFNVSIRVIRNDQIQLITINTGIIDRLLNLNTVVLYSSANVGFPHTHGGVTLRHVPFNAVLMWYAPRGEQSK